MVATNLDKVTVRAQYVDYDGTPMAGSVVFTPSTTAIDVSGKKILFPKQYLANLDSNGSIVIGIPASNDPDILPNIFTYKVVENIGSVGRTFNNIQIPYSALATGFDLSTVLIDGSESTGPTYLSTSDATAVHKDGAEDITGIKTFTVSPIVPTPTTTFHPTTKAYVDGIAIAGSPDATGSVKGIVKLTAALGGTADTPTTPTSVHLTGNETVAGIKTFSSSPIIPTPTTSTQAANKAYADSVGGISTDAIVNAVMDGVTDGTAALATAVATAQVSTTGGGVYIPSGKLLVKDTTIITGNNILVHGPGQIIMSNSPNTGTLKSAGRVFYISDATGVSITVDIKAPTSMTNYSLAGIPAVIMFDNTIECNIQYSRMTGFATTNILTGIIINGPSADSNKIVANRLDGVGIAYSYAGANRTTCSFNTILNSPNNSLGCVGPGTGLATDNRVLDNTVINCGRFGIEDYGTTDRTIIRGNTIDGAGALESGMGISAVGQNCIVSENTIVNIDGTYGIEMAGNGNRCVNNNIKQETAGLVGIGTGIIVNNHTPSEEIKGAVIDGNTVHGFGIMIDSLSVIGTVMITNNQLNNPKIIGVKIDTADVTSSLIIANNSIRMVTANTADRTAFSIFSTAAVGAFGCQIIGNHVFYESTATGGPGIEYLVKPGTNDILVLGNVFDGGGVVNGTIGPIVYSGGAVLSGFRLINNTFRGGAVGNLQSVVAPEVSGNKGVTFATATDNRLGFYQAQGTPVVKPAVTGSKGSNAALTSLMTALVNLGLVTDSTT